MCGNIKTLFNFEPPASDDEVRASAIQFVRKISGTRKPSKINEAAFNLAVDKIEAAARELVDTLVTSANSRSRDEEARKSKQRFKKISQAS